MHIHMAADMDAHDVLHGFATNTGKGSGAVVYRLMMISLFVCWRDVKPVLGQLVTGERLGEEHYIRFNIRLHATLNCIAFPWMLL